MGQHTSAFKTQSRMRTSLCSVFFRLKTAKKELEKGLD